MLSNYYYYYHNGTFIHDATFALQETIRKYVGDGNIVYQLVCDYEKSLTVYSFLLFFLIFINVESKGELADLLDRQCIVEVGGNAADPFIAK